MRIAVLIIGILIGLFFIFFGFIGVVTETDELKAAGHYDTTVGAYWGMMLLWALGVAFVLGLPFIAALIFAGAGVWGVWVGVVGGEPAAIIGTWGLASLVLAVMAFFGLIGASVTRAWTE